MTATIIEPCLLCPDFIWCGRKGCVAWNDGSRKAHDDMKQRAKRNNEFIDELEQWIELVQRRLF